MKSLKRLGNYVYGLGQRKILVFIMAPSFIVYGACIAVIGYGSQFIHVLGLPVIYYAGLFILAGILKFVFLYFGKEQLSHTIGVSIATFWSMCIFLLAPSVAGSLTAVPWIIIGLVCLFGAIWPDSPKAVLVVPKVLDDDTNPAMRAIDYVENVKKRHTH